MARKKRKDDDLDKDLNKDRLDDVDDLDADLLENEEGPEEESSDDNELE